ncbi:hypothetical protein VNO80_18887 [Phaseolus coccineus]|uniref:Uncharacterized protein n=1 Tax=Phaseolus coccineus TaxID=3886 RepID=A0AAN9MEY9_PHACN
MHLAPWRCPHASRALAMPACLSRPGDARMPLAPWRCPHASRALAMPACLSRPGDARMPLAPWSLHPSSFFLLLLLVVLDWWLISGRGDLKKYSNVQCSKVIGKSETETKEDTGVPKGTVPLSNISHASLLRHRSFLCGHSDSFPFTPIGSSKHLSLSFFHRHWPHHATASFCAKPSSSSSSSSTLPVFIHTPLSPQILFVLLPL